MSTRTKMKGAAARGSPYAGLRLTIAARVSCTDMIATSDGRLCRVVGLRRIVRAAAPELIEVRYEAADDTTRETLYELETPVVVRSMPTVRSERALVADETWIARRRGGLAQAVRDLRAGLSREIVAEVADRDSDEAQRRAANVLRLVHAASRMKR